jgi:hypothetical protein
MKPIGEEPKDQQPEPSAAEEKQAMICQVRLKGPTIRQAWFNNKQLRDLEPSTNFTPEEFGGRDVFHGTNHQLSSPLWCQAWNDNSIHPSYFEDNEPNGTPGASNEQCRLKCERNGRFKGQSTKA